MNKKKSFFQLLFGGKKSTECCNCSGNEASACSSNQTEPTAPILILGSGCKNCQTLEENAKTALSMLGKNLEVGHITDFSQIASYGVMSTPGLVVNNNVVSCGKVLTPEEIAELLKSTEL